jgi:hypothetical protein
MLLVVFSISSPLNAQIEKSPVEIIEQKMAEQEICWSRGDIDCFMRAYWKSDSLRFIGSKGLSYGWQTTLENYKKSYPTTETMGKLTFTNLHVTQLSDNFISVIGRWKLVRSIGDISGHYSLIWRKIDDEWVIISDHTS